MVLSLASQALHSYVEDEMLRAPLLFDAVVSGTVHELRKAMPGLAPGARAAQSDLALALQTQGQRLSDYFMRSLRQQVSDELASRTPSAGSKPKQPGGMALVDEDEVAMDVALSHTIEAIRNMAEYELRELQTYTAALVGDMEVAQDHNPFRPETYARALFASAAALPLSRGFQVSFLRHAGTCLADVLRKAYASSSSRLEALGIEPGSHRTLILPSGSRRGRSGETTYSPDLQRMRDSMPLTSDASRQPPSKAHVGAPDPGHARMAGQAHDVGFEVKGHSEQQSLELMGRLFDAIAADKRVPADVLGLIARLRKPAQRLSLLEAQMLDQEAHPLWGFINRLAYEAEMAPDAGDPERLRLLKVASATIEQLTGEVSHNTALYGWAVERLDVFLQQRLSRRCSAVASHIGALQKLEDRLVAGQAVNSTMHGTLDVPQLDTVPAELMHEAPPTASAPLEDTWLEGMRPGDWLRMFLQGHWVHVQLLWPGERREIWLFGDGASDATFAVRKRALVAMREAHLLKGLRQRSLLRRAAQAVQEQVAAG